MDWKRWLRGVSSIVENQTNLEGRDERKMHEDNKVFLLFRFDAPAFGGRCLCADK